MNRDLVFEPWDFEALAPDRARSPEYNDRRLLARRRLGGLAKTFVARAKEEGLALDSRTSIHNPHSFNGGKVQRLWAYLTRSKKDKTGLRKVLGRDLAKDLDSAYRNAYLCLAIEHDRLEVSFRIHADAWYDGRNLTRRVDGEGVHAWLSVLNTLEGFQLRLHDWKGEWRCGSLTPEALEEFLRFYEPGDHALVVDRRWPVPTEPAAREAVLSEEVPRTLLDELARLVPLYRFAAWSPDSDHLFG
ncbi:MAG: hypothetical protein GY711_34560 [bacterium]|nr:hypothetical protein [bacterium]